MTRRDLMRGAVAAAFPIGRVAAAEPVGPVMAKLSAHLSEAQGRALPPEVIEKAKHHILDTFAAIISGAQLQPGKVAIAFARARGGEKVATVAGSNVVCGAIDAAFANGMLAHSDETDDYATPQGLPFFQRLSSSSVPERSVIGKLVRTACKGVWIVEESNRMCAPEVQSSGKRQGLNWSLVDSSGMRGRPSFSARVLLEQGLVDNSMPIGTFLGRCGTSLTFTDKRLVS